MTDISTNSKTNWGRWGADDEVGALNLITAERRLAGLQAASTGALYSLGLPVHSEKSPTVPFRSPIQRLTVASNGDQATWDAIGERMGVPSPGTGANEDMIITATHNGTHMDALCHVFQDGKLYNGFPAESVTPLRGAAHASIDKVEGAAGRGVLLDVAGYLGVPWLAPETHIGDELLEQVREAQGTVIHEGDMLLVRTGWLDYYAESKMSGDALSGGQAGLDRSAVDFIDRYQISVVGADNSAVECLPCEDEYLSVHVALLLKRGIHLLEHLDLHEISAAGCHEFFLVLAPMKIVGGTGSPINPIAIG